MVMRMIRRAREYLTSSATTALLKAMGVNYERRVLATSVLAAMHLVCGSREVSNVLAKGDEVVMAVGVM
jgi:hypothetical protein